MNNFVHMHLVLWEAYLQGKFSEVRLLSGRTKTYIVLLDMRTGIFLTVLFIALPLSSRTVLGTQ